MDEKKRTKILGSILAVVLVFMGTRPDKKLLEPIDTAKKKLKAAQDRYDREDAKKMQLDIARNNIDRANATSLPPRVTDAQRLYQSWITNLAEQCRFSQLSVIPGSKSNVRGQYSTVNIDLEAEADLENLSRFLYLAEQADLMHRISSLEIESTGSSGSPRMEIRMTLEGMSMAAGVQRGDIFARTVLPKEVDADATELTVAEAADFPKKVPFVVQVGREMMKVTGAEGNKWTVERGLEATSAAEHTEEVAVYQFPISPLRKDVSFNNYQNFLDASPFVKPAPERTYRPRLGSLADKTIKPGEKVEMTARAEDINKDVGAAKFSLMDPMDGMTIDPETGEFSWETTEEMEPKRYETTFVLEQENNAELRVEKKIGITLRLPNEAPELTVAESAVVVLGQEFTLNFAAEDDGGLEALKYSLEGEVPEGLSLEGNQLTWIPGKTFVPGEYEVTVKVTDSAEPPASDSEVVTLEVKDDDAKMTMFTGSVSLDGTPVAWFRNIARNERPELRLGDRIAVAEIDARLTEIDRRHVLMTDDAGIWKVKLGENLRQRILVKAAAPPPVEDDSKDPEATEEAESEAAETPNESATDYDKDPPPASESEDGETKPKAETPADPNEKTDEPVTTDAPASEGSDAEESKPAAKADAEETDQPVESPTVEPATDEKAPAN